MDKLKMHSLNKVDENIKKIGALFPNCLTERKNENGEVEYAIDFDMLKQELSSVVVEGNEERYQFTWPDKKKSILLANAPIAKTLRPCREESVDFDTTENLYIEGDNLDVLKLLQETYLGKIKMIYIDPPYNTGNDFIYNDDFAEDADTYLANSGQFDAEGNRLVQNTESNGRFHTDWLNMIYPRLKLAKDLLAEDGVIFISIDDNEVENAKKIGMEILGNDSFIAQIIVVSNPKGRNDGKHFAQCHEYLLAFAKSKFLANGLPLTEDQRAMYDKTDENGNEYQLRDLRKRGNGDKRSDRPHMYFPIYFNPSTQCSSLTKQDGWVEIVPQLGTGEDGRWRWGKERVAANLHLLEPHYSERSKKWGINYRIYLNPRLNPLDDDDGDEKTSKSKTFWTDSDISSDIARRTLKNLLGCSPFDFPKSVGLIKRLIQIGADKDSIVMDFFSGSSTTAHAVMQLNAEDGGNRKLIMVQLPEETDRKSEAYKAGYKNICEIGKERIRRAGTKIREESPLTTQKLDAGFRVLKLDSSNMKDVYYTPADYEMSMFETLADNIKEDRTPEDLLFQVMLDLGVLLSSKIEESIIGGKKVFNVADGFLMACFDENVSEEVITAIAKQKPYYFVMRDSSMASDSVATNFDQIFATYSPDTVRKVL